MLFDSLFSDRLKQPEGTDSPREVFPPDASGRWALRVSPTVKIRFDEDAEGRIKSFTVLLPDGQEIVRPRINRK